MAQRRFSHDIQGLRAFGMFMVLFFHAKILEDVISASFLAIDMFFVISGFLITRIVHDQVMAGTFSFSEFYIRRVRRLIPASIVTIFVTIIVGWFIMGPNAMANLGREALHAQFISANVVFWLDAGYFDSVSQTKPFLHFWSLSVEEQFYLFWPSLVIFLMWSAKRLGFSPRWMLLVVMSVLSLLSLWAAQVYYATDPSAVYYLLPFRVFEFGIGAIVVIAGWEIRKFREIGWLVGFSMLAGSFVIFSERSQLPGVLSLMAVIGTSLCLMSQDAKSGFILRNRFATFLGNASYSVYLAHWPIMAFYYYQFGLDISLWERLMLVALALIFGFLLYYTVENRMRQASFWKAHGRILSSALVAGVTAYASAFAWAHYGSQTSLDHLNFNRDRLVTNLQSYRMTKDSRYDDRIRPTIYVIGDSHGRDMANMLDQFSRRARIQRLGLGNQCLRLFSPEIESEPLTANEKMSCDKAIANLEANLEKPVKAIVLAFKWKDIALADGLFSYVNDRVDLPVFVAENGIEFEKSIAQWADANRDKLGETIGAEQYEDLNQTLKTKAEAEGFRLFPKASILCSDNLCPYMNTEKTTLYYMDKHHMTLDGALFYAARFKDCKTPVCADVKRLIRQK